LGSGRNGGRTNFSAGGGLKELGGMGEATCVLRKPRGKDPEMILRLARVRWAYINVVPD